MIQEEVPAGDDEAAFAELDAKRLLGSKGAFAKALGRTPDVTRVARNLRLEELHSDVHGLLGRLRQRAGLASVDVVVRNQVDFSA